MVNRAHGFRFDHLSFVAAQRRSEKARVFLDHFRHSQMYEVFVTERLALAAHGFRTTDSFEAKVLIPFINSGLRVQGLGFR